MSIRTDFSSAMSGTPRLLFIAERFDPDIGGVAKSATRTATAITALGVDVEVLAWSRTLPAGQTQVVQRSLPSSVSQLRVHRVGLFANLDYSLQHTLAYLDALHRTHPFQAVWGHYLFPSGFFGAMFAGLHDLPVTLSARGNDVDMMMFPPGDFARLLWTLDVAQSITAVSHDLANKIRVLTKGIARVQVIHNSVDASLFHPAPADAGLRAALGIETHEVVLGFSGELRHKKGLTSLLRAFVEVSAARPCVLLVIGEVRVRDQASLATFAVEHPEIRKRIIITGHLEEPHEVARHLQLCDVFLQPSIWDGLPNAVLEAMACGRLVVASDAGGIPEIIEHGTNGFVIPRVELGRLGEGILEILAQPPEVRAAIGESARRRMIDAFSPELEKLRLQRVLDQLIANE